MNGEVIFWRGNATHNTLTVDHVWGDPRMVDLMFGESGSHGTRRLHPLAAHSPSDSSILQRREAWIQSMLAGSSTEALEQQYVLELFPSATPQAIQRPNYGVTESIVVDHDRSDRPSSASLIGHLRLTRSAVGLSLERTQEVVSETRMSFHKINNDLSIASMNLELVAIRLKGNPLAINQDEILESCESARAAVRNAGRIANETLHRFQQ